MAGPKVTLSRAEFVQGAFEIVDREGLSALTMRSLGDHLGVDATAIYRYFPSKERLIDGMLDAILADASSAEAVGDTPRARIVSLALNVREAVRRHPHVAGALAMGSGDFPSGLTLSRALIRELRAVGLTGVDLVRMYQTFEGYILGSCVLDTGGHPDTFSIRQDRYRYLDEPEFTAVATSPENVEHVTESAFVGALEVLLDHCERLVDP